MNPNTLISDIMTQMPYTLAPDSTLADVNEMFEQHSFHHIPVLDHGNLVGIISRQDFLQMQYVLKGGWDGNITTTNMFQNFSARDIMTEYPMFLSPDDTIGLAADIFMSNKFHALPILDDQTLVGIITAHDLIAFAYTSPIESSN